MGFDVKEKIDEIVAKVKNDPKLAEKFKSEPVKALEEIIGTDLPDDKIQPVIDGVKAKLAAGNAADALGKITGLFKK